jgi:hypothetical protein
LILGKIEDRPITSHAISLITKKPIEIRQKLKKKTPLDAQMTDDDVIEEPALASSNNSTNLPVINNGTSAQASSKKKPGPKKGTKKKTSADPASSSSKITPAVVEIPKPKTVIPDKGKSSRLGPLPTLIMEKINILREEASRSDFSEKKNFPAHLKPLFAEAVIAAMDLQLLNNTFWEHIIDILPYNCFTMKVN